MQQEIAGYFAARLVWTSSLGAKRISQQGRGVSVSMLQLGGSQRVRWSRMEVDGAQVASGACAPLGRV